jgi:hypothetical protein
MMTVVPSFSIRAIAAASHFGGRTQNSFKKGRRELRHSRRAKARLRVTVRSSRTIRENLPPNLDLPDRHTLGASCVDVTGPKFGGGSGALVIDMTTRATGVVGEEVD